MKVFTYIIHSDFTDSYYVGITNNVKIRLKEHNSEKTKYTSKANDWKIIYSAEFGSRIEAYNHEQLIKSTGPRRFVERNIK